MKKSVQYHQAIRERSKSQSSIISLQLEWLLLKRQKKKNASHTEKEPLYTDGGDEN